LAILDRSGARTAAYGIHDQKGDAIMANGTSSRQFVTVFVSLILSFDV
jgi:hypothetical protein